MTIEELKIMKNVKQNKIELARVQYQMASDKYSDEMSKSIISMKIANIGN